jgi:hypothetical protein
MRTEALRPTPGVQKQVNRLLRLYDGGNRLNTYRLAAALVVTAFVTTPAPAQQLEPVRYLLRIPAPATHYMEVQATYPTSRQAVVELMMPVWTPGSYLVREFARHVEEVQARDPSGRPLRVESRARIAGGCRPAGPAPWS